MSTDNSTSWTPNESSQDLWNERSYLDGIFIGAVAYGVHATLFFITLSLLWTRAKTNRKDYGWIAYIVVLFAISSIGNGTQLKFTEMIWIDNRNYPGGPAVYFIEGSTDFMAVFCNSIYIANTWLQDGLLLYRFWIIFGRSYLIAVFPALLYLASVGLACFLFFMLSSPDQTIWSVFSFFTAYWSISVGFNILVTLAIVVRLLIMRHRIGKVMPNSSSPYVSISAMLIESAFLYSAAGVIFIITYGLNSPVQNLVLPTLAQVESIAPLLIIMRVAQGQAWTSDTATHVTNSGLGFRNNTSVTPGTKFHTSDTYALSSIPGITALSSKTDGSTAVGSRSKLYELESEHIA